MCAHSIPQSTLFFGKIKDLSEGECGSGVKKRSTSVALSSTLLPRNCQKVIIKQEVRKLIFFLVAWWCFTWCCLLLSVQVPCSSSSSIYKGMWNQNFGLIVLFTISNHLHVLLFIRSFFNRGTSIDWSIVYISHSPPRCLYSFGLQYSAVFVYCFLFCREQKVRFLCSLLLDFWFHILRNFLFRHLSVRCIETHSCAA